MDTEYTEISKCKILVDLAAMHRFDKAGRLFLEGQWEDMFSYRWHNDLYKHLTRPGASFTSGEVASVLHA